MTVINTRITVSPDGAIATATPLPAGDHAARIEVADQACAAASHPFL